MSDVAETVVALQRVTEVRGDPGVEQAEDAMRRLDTALAVLRAELDHERRRAEEQRERANQLAVMLKDIHRSLFAGGIHMMILRACLAISGGTRGVYLTARGHGHIKVRAAVDVDGYPQEPPSDFLAALCRRVLESHDTIVCNEPDACRGLPEPEREGERFHNFIVAPVVLLKNLDGIVLVADKPTGDFHAEDVETLVSIGDQAAVAVENVRLQRELQHAYLATVSMLADAAEAKDSYTHGHCETVSRLARLTADKLCLADREKSIVCYSALLHDIGKIGVSDGVLNKPGPLLPEEKELVRAHVRIGYDLIRSVPALGDVATAVLHHHEWYDGTGYPDGLEGEEIPIASRIVGAVDAYCAMRDRRSYKESYSDEQARAELSRYAGTQFDPKVVRVLLSVLDSKESEDQDPDHDAECGVLPGFGRLLAAG